MAIGCRMKDAFLKCFTYGLSVDFSKFYFLRNGNFHSVNKLLRLLKNITCLCLSVISVFLVILTQGFFMLGCTLGKFITP